MPEPAVYRVRHAEYAFVETQSNTRAMCPFCQRWHSTQTGMAMSGDCPGVYHRSRKAAFVVRGIAKGRAGAVGGQRTTPTGRNLQRAIQHAIATKYEQLGG